MRNAARRRNGKTKKKIEEEGTLSRQKFTEITTGKSFERLEVLPSSNPLHGGSIDIKRVPGGILVKGLFARKTRQKIFQKTIFSPKL